MTSIDPGQTPPLPDEDADIRQIADRLTAHLRESHRRGDIARRDAHPKHHGIVRAEFHVDPALPHELRHGLFAVPRAYPAWIRFSNGSPTIQSDRRRDQRGMAIKLMDVPGQKVLAAEADAPTQDFILASCPRFFIRNVRDYVEFTRKASRGSKARMLTYFFGGLPWRWRLHEWRALTGSLQHADDLVTLRYWSQTPYRLGPHAVKYSARPMHTAPLGLAVDPAAGDHLRQTLAARLAAGPATFEFLVQKRTDPATMPIEDSTIIWDEARAPFVRVATITIPRQRFDAPVQMALAENISYSPWHTLPDHAPMGGVNRTRRVVYEAISAARHDLNGRARQEPTSLRLDE